MILFLKNLGFLGGGTIFSAHFFSIIFFFKKNPPLSYSAWLFWSLLNCSFHLSPLLLFGDAFEHGHHATSELWRSPSHPGAIWKNMGKSSNWVKIFPQMGMKITNIQYLKSTFGTVPTYWVLHWPFTNLYTFWYLFHLFWIKLHHLKLTAHPWK